MMGKTKQNRGNHMRQFIGLFALVTALAGCTDFPQLDAAVTDKARAAAYPELVPTEGLLAKRGNNRVSETTGPELLARAQRLQARARLLRGIEVVNDETRRRLAGPLRRLGG